MDTDFGLLMVNCIYEKGLEKHVSSNLCMFVIVSGFAFISGI